MARKKRGPSFSEDLAKEIIDIAKQGATNKQIGEKLGLTEQTIENWTTEKESLIKAIKEAKEPTDNTVEATLLQKALGYKRETVKLFFDPKSLQVIEHRYMIDVEPDLGSICMWLKNRRPEKWRESKSLIVENVNDASKNQILSEVGTQILASLNKWNDEK